MFKKYLFTFFASALFFFNVQFVFAAVYNETQSTSGEVIQTMIGLANPNDVLRLEGPSGGTSHIFYENVIINKPLTIYGVSSSTIVIDGSGTGNPITINSSNVTVRDLTVTDAFPDSDSAGVRANSGYANILIENIIATGNTGAGIHVTSGDSIIRNCVTTDNVWGVRIDFDSNFTVDGCLIYNNNRIDTEPEPDVYGQGIRVVTVSSSTISNNTIYGNAREGILVTDNSLNLNINNNIIYGNGVNVSDGGVGVTNSEYILLEENTIRNNTGSGIKLGTATSSSILSNNIYSNTVSNIFVTFSNLNIINNNQLGTSTASDNIKLDRSNNNTISLNEIFSTLGAKFAILLTGSGGVGSNLNNINNNLIRNNDNGIQIENSSNSNTIEKNEIRNSATQGIRITSGIQTIKSNNIHSNNRGIRIGTNDNIIYDNYFQNTTNSYSSTGTSTWNVLVDTIGPNILEGTYFGGNYWSNYVGVDNNGDGFGDTPYITAGVVDNKPLVSKVLHYADLIYLSSEGGSITGDTEQQIPLSESGTTVTAVANSGYAFVSWDDDNTNATRIDNNILANATYTASFELLEVEPEPEPEPEPTDTEPVQNNKSSTSRGSSAKGRYNRLMQAGKIEEAQKIQEQFPNAFTSSNVSSINNSEQILQLLISLGFLQNQEITELQNQIKSPEEKFVFRRDLDLGFSGEDVRELQKFLNRNGFVLAPSGPGSIGNETIIFGYATQNALKNFQKAKNIQPALGYFGPKTRGFINSAI